MKSFFSLSINLSLLPSLILGTPLPTSSHALQAQTIFQLPKGSWIENLAVRSNDQVLLNALSSPDLYSYNPRTTKTTHLHTFPEALGLLGITENHPDTFALIAGNFSTNTLSDGAGSYAIWSVSFPDTSSSKPAIRKITSLPEGILLNGIGSLPSNPEVVLIGDGGLGLIWSLNTRTGVYKKQITGIPEMAPVASAPAKSGINGLKVVPGWIYFTNTFAGLYRLAITDKGDVEPGARVETIGLGSAWDDIAIDDRGIWATGGVRDELLFYHHESRNTLAGPAHPGHEDKHGHGSSKEQDKWVGEVVLGNNRSLTVAGATAAQFGRGLLKDVLYVTTTGAKAAPVNGTVTEGGKAVAIDTKGFRA